MLSDPDMRLILHYTTGILNFFSMGDRHNNMFAPGINFKLYPAWITDKVTKNYLIIIRRTIFSAAAYKYQFLVNEKE